MPMYEYECRDCGQVIEQLRKMDEADSELACPHCGSKNTVRKHSVFNAGPSESAGSSGSSACDQCCPYGGNCGM